MIYHNSFRVSKCRYDMFIQKPSKIMTVYLFAYDAGINQLFSRFADWFLNNNQFMFTEMIAV